MSEKGVGVGRSPYPLPLLLIFCAFSQFRSLRVLYFRKLALNLLSSIERAGFESWPGTLCCVL